MRDTQKAAKSTTARKDVRGRFTDEERGAMKERVQELKAAARRGPRADKADGESAVLAKIAEMPVPDRAMGERLHAIITASAPALSPRLWYGMPASVKDGKGRLLLPMRAEVQDEVRDVRLQRRGEPRRRRHLADRLRSDGVDRRRRGKDRRAREASGELRTELDTGPRPSGTAWALAKPQPAPPQQSADEHRRSEVKSRRSVLMRATSGVPQQLRARPGAPSGQHGEPASPDPGARGVTGHAFESLWADPAIHNSNTFVFSRWRLRLDSIRSTASDRALEAIRKDDQAPVWQLPGRYPAGGPRFGLKAQHLRETASMRICVMRIRMMLERLPTWPASSGGPGRRPSAILGTCRG